MEKLIELLNEYIKKNIKTPNRCIWYSCSYFWFDGWTDVIEDTIISKRYWFIKWLVDNKKIDQTNKFCVSVNVEWKGMGYTKAFEGYESLLMLLAIQDEPLTFLISILK